MENLLRHYITMPGRIQEGILDAQAERPILITWEARMFRKAFLMSVQPGREEEYQQRHSPVWPEMEQTLKSHGVHNYSIFLHEATQQLFGYVEIESEERWNAIGQTETCRRWWAYMQDIMPSNPDNSPIITELKPVFYLE